MRRTAKLRRLTLREWGLLFLALGLLPLIDGGLRLAGFRRVYRALRWLSPSPPHAAPPVPPAVSAPVVRMVNAAATYGLMRVSCLRRSLAIWWLLRWQGVSSDLVIGVRRQQSGFEAHAWVEQAGLVLNDRADIATAFAPIAPDSGLGHARWV